MRLNRVARAVLASALAVSFTAGHPAFAQETQKQETQQNSQNQSLARITSADPYKAISTCSEEILLKELDLERMYLKYWLVARKEPKLRRIRYFLAQQGAASGYLANNIVVGIQTGSNLKHPERVSEHALKAGYNTAIVAGILAGSASAFELGSNTYTAIKNKINKQDPGTAFNTFATRIKEIDALLADREAKMQQLGECRAHKILAEEGHLLKYFRDWCIADFAEIYSDIKSFQAGNNVFFAMDASANSLIAATFFISKAAFKHDSLEGASLIASIPADAVVLISAPFSSWVGSMLGKHYQKKFYKRLNEQPHDVAPLAEESLRRLDQLASSADGETKVQIDTFATRLDTSRTWSSRCVKFISDREDDLRHSSKVAAQENIAGPLIGGTFLEQDVADTVGYYKYRNHEKTANAIAFSGCIVSGAGSVASIAFSTKLFIDESRHHKRLKKAHQLPEELIQGRLKTVDQLEAQIKGTRVY